MVACLYSSPSLAATEPSRLLSLEVVVNGQKTGTWLLLEQDDKLYAPHDAFEEWRVQLDPATQSPNGADHSHERAVFRNGGWGALVVWRGH